MSNDMIPSPSADLGPWTGSEIIEAASGSWLFRIEPLNDDEVVASQVEAGSLAAVRATANLLENASSAAAGRSTSRLPGTNDTIVVTPPSRLDDRPGAVGRADEAHKPAGFEGWSQLGREVWLLR